MRWSCWIVALVMSWGASWAWAQQELALYSIFDRLDRVPAAWKARPRLPGVEFHVDPQRRWGELSSRHDMIHILNLDPKFGERPWSENLAQGVVYTSPKWQLDFWFKPVRIIEVDVPTPEGKFVRKHIWYMVYRVRNTAKYPVRFVPWFVLHTEDLKRYYPDRLVPVAMEPIMRRERPPRVLLDTVEMASIEIPPARPGRDDSIWGVACWEDVDPRTDYFSVYVQGLNNIFRREAVSNPQGKKRWKLFRKTLRLYFWRPGDATDPNDWEIRFGRPGHIAYEWVYR